MSIQERLFAVTLQTEQGIDLIFPSDCAILRMFSGGTRFAKRVVLYAMTSTPGHDVLIVPTSTGTIITIAPHQPMTLPQQKSSGRAGVMLVALMFMTLLFPRVGSAATFTANDVMVETNTVRQQFQLPSLRVNQQLMTAAEAKANDMFAHHYFSHQSPTGQDPWSWLHQAGYTFTSAGENLAIDYVDADTVLHAWMKSPAHRANLLSEKFQDVGVAVVEGVMDGQVTMVVVELFGSQTVTSPAGVITPPAPLHDSPAPLLPAQENILPDSPKEQPAPEVLGITDASVHTSPAVTLTPAAPSEIAPDLADLPRLLLTALAAQIAVVAAAVLVQRHGHWLYPQAIKQEQPA